MQFVSFYSMNPDLGEEPGPRGMTIAVMGTAGVPAEGPLVHSFAHCTALLGLSWEKSCESAFHSGKCLELEVRQIPFVISSRRVTDFTSLGLLFMYKTGTAIIPSLLGCKMCISI